VALKTRSPELGSGVCDHPPGMVEESTAPIERHGRMMARSERPNATKRRLPTARRTNEPISRRVGLQGCAKVRALEV
jgi:hypothetical protein